MSTRFLDDGLRQGSVGDHCSAIGAHFRMLLSAMFGTASSFATAASPQPLTYLKRPAGILIPSGERKQAWDLFIMSLVLYSAASLPFRLCFEARAEGMLWEFEASISIIFLIDVYLTFNTALEQEGLWVYDRTRIATEYLKGWFWIDVPSAVPVEFLEVLVEQQVTSSWSQQKHIENLAILRFLRMFRLVRLLRLLKVKEYVTRVEEHFNINLKALKLVEIFLKLGFIAHFLACGWFYMHVLAVHEDEGAVTWVSSYDDGSALDGSKSKQYLFALYWALTTMSTVGYGDITPSNDRERTFATFSLVVGALSFAFINGNVVAVLASLDNHSALVEGKMEAVKEYVQWRTLPKDLVTRVRRYFEHYYERTAVFDESVILTGLNPNLRVEVVDHILNEKLGRLPIFSLLNSDFKLDIFPKLKPISFAAGETVYIKGAQARALFFHMSGEIDVYRGSEVPKRKKKLSNDDDDGVTVPTFRMAMTRRGSSIEADDLTDWTGDLGPTSRVSPDGEFLLRQNGSGVTTPRAHQGIFGQSTLLGRRREATLVARTDCEALLIAKEDLLRLFENDPFSARRISVLILEDFLRMDRLSMLALRLRILAHRKVYGNDREWGAMTVQLYWRRYSDLVARASEPIYELIESEGQPFDPTLAKAVAGRSSVLSAAGTSPGGSSRQASPMQLRRQASILTTLDLRRAAADQKSFRARGPSSYRGGGGGDSGKVLAKMSEMMRLLLDVKSRVEHIEATLPVLSNRGGKGLAGLGRSVSTSLNNVVI